MEKAQTFADDLKAASPNPAYDDLNEFLADPSLDAVLITSADKLHADHVVACANAGKHVLVEKPFVTNLDDGRRAIEACRSQNVVLAVVYHLRWHAGHRELHRRISNGEIGDVQHLRLLYPWRAEDGSNWRAHEEVGRWWSLGGTGTHCLDLLRWFGGQPFSNVSKRQSIIRNGTWVNDHDETAILTFEYENGVTAQATSSVLFEAPSRFEIFGSKGYAVCDATVGHFGAGRIEINGEPVEFTAISPFEGLIQDFVSAIKEGRDPEVTGEMGLENVQELVFAKP